MSTVNQELWQRALVVALDSTAMTAYLVPQQDLSVPSSLPAPAGLEVTGLALVDHKPGRRGLVRYELSAGDGQRRRVVYGKLYGDSSQLQRVNQTLQALHGGLAQAGLPHSVPRPLGVIPELSMLVYQPVEGCFLDEAIARGCGAAALEATAAWLGAFHRQPLAPAKSFDLASELANLAEWAAVVAQSYPQLAAAAADALGYLQKGAPGLAAELNALAQGPIHKDFHYRHVLVGRGVKVIDFDEVRLGDPNLDLAHFCANLDLLAYRRCGAPQGLRRLTRRFLEAYAAATGWSRAVHRARFDYFYVYTCLKLARQLCLGFGPSPVPTGDARRREAAMILQQAAVRAGLRKECI